MSTLLLVLTSAGIAAFVSGLIAFAGQWLERRARRHELLLAKAIELAFARTEFVKQFAKQEGVPARYFDNLQLAEVYYQQLSHLMRTGQLPAEVEAAPSAKRRAT